MTASEDKADVLGADAMEKLQTLDETTPLEPRETAEQASPGGSSSTPGYREPARPEEAGREEAGEQPAGPSEDDPAQLKERLLRVLAEQQNFQRRLERERDDAVRFAATQMVKELLQTADNLSRALQSVTPGDPDQNEALRSLVGGVAASERALQDTFSRHGIRRIQPALGDPFDPNHHQAMFELEGSGCEPGTIAQVVLPGYTYHERLIRPAFVGVAREGSPLPS
jgi:molecular chaperone GrpE